MKNRKFIVMKKIQLVMCLLACFVLNGCVISGERYHPTSYGLNNWQRSLAAPIRQSDIPAEPVRRHSFRYTDGSYSYSHYQGTDTQILKCWDPYAGAPRTEIRQSTYNNTSVNYSPRYYCPQTYSVPSPSGYVQGYIPLIPQFRR